jgi:hypothetical protein
VRALQLVRTALCLRPSRGLPHAVWRTSMPGASHQPHRAMASAAPRHGSSSTTRHHGCSPRPGRSPWRAVAVYRLRLAAAAGVRGNKEEVHSGMAPSAKAEHAAHRRPGEAGRGPSPGPPDQRSHARSAEQVQRPRAPREWQVRPGPQERRKERRGRAASPASVAGRPAGRPAGWRGTRWAAADRRPGPGPVRAGRCAWAGPSRGSRRGGGVEGRVEGHGGALDHAAHAARHEQQRPPRADEIRGRSLKRRAGAVAVAVAVAGAVAVVVAVAVAVAVAAAVAVRACFTWPGSIAATAAESRYAPPTAKRNRCLPQRTGSRCDRNRGRRLPTATADGYEAPRLPCVKRVLASCIAPSPASAHLSCLAQAGQDIHMPCPDRTWCLAQAHGTTHGPRPVPLSCLGALHQPPRT